MKSISTIFGQIYFCLLFLNFCFSLVGPCSSNHLRPLSFQQEVKMFFFFSMLLFQGCAFCRNLPYPDISEANND